MASDKKKIILHVFPSLELGGAQARFKTLLKHGSRRYKHIAIAMDGCFDAVKPPPAATQAAAKAAAADLDLETLETVGPGIPKGSIFRAVRKCRKHLKQIRPDLLITYNWGTIEWSLANRLLPLCPMVHVQDGFGHDELAVEQAGRRFTRRFAYQGCKKVIVPSRALEKLARQHWHITDTKLAYIPNAIDIERFARDTDQKTLSRYGLAGKHPLVGTVAGLRPEKNVGRLIEAFYLSTRDRPKARLVIIGDGIGMAALKMLADRIGLKESVVFTGSMEAPEQLLPALDIFALSSDTEQMPLSVIEAMATGLPVAATDVGDVKDMVSTENKSFIGAISADALGKNIDALLKDPETAKAVGEANRQKARTFFAQDTMVSAYDTLYARILP